MIVNDGANVMLVGEPVFRTLTRREPCNTVRLTEALLAVSYRGFDTSEHAKRCDRGRAGLLGMLGSITGGARRA